MIFENSYQGDGGTGGSLGNADAAAAALLASAGCMADFMDPPDFWHEAAEASRLNEEIEMARANELAAQEFVKQAEERLKHITPQQEQMLIQERDSLRTALQASQKHFARTCEAGLDATRAATSNVRRIVQELSAECRKSEKTTEYHEEELQVMRCQVAQATEQTEQLCEERESLKMQVKREQDIEIERAEAKSALQISAQISECKAENEELQMQIEAEQGLLREEQAAEKVALEKYSECATSAQALHRRAMAAELRHRIVRRESEEANNRVADYQRRLSEEASRRELQTVRQQRSEGHLRALAGEVSRHHGAARRLAMWAVVAVAVVEMWFRFAEIIGL